MRTCASTVHMRPSNNTPSSMLPCASRSGRGVHLLVCKSTLLPAPAACCVDATVIALQAAEGMEVGNDALEAKPLHKMQYRCDSRF